MKLVLDASVAVAAMRTSEPSHAAARARIERAIRNADALLLPPIFPAEVGGALARLGVPEAQIRRLVDALVRSPHEVVTMGPKRAGATQSLAMNGRLRGADAVYVWLANARNVTLCTLDDEMTRRGGAFCTVISP
jgi:predicted nucleic acid-binding protein